MSIGVHEEPAAFEGPDHRMALVGTPFEGLNRYRTFGESGPMYEVMSVGQDTVRIFLYNSWEETDYRLDRALADPVAS